MSGRNATRKTHDQQLPTALPEMRRGLYFADSSRDECDALFVHVVQSSLWHVLYAFMQGSG